MKMINITDFLTPKEIKLALKLQDAHAICTEIITPNIDRINQSLNQENDPMYLAYAVKYVIPALTHK